MQGFKTETDNFDAFLQAKIDTFLYGDKDFIYKNDIEKVWTEYADEHGHLTWGVTTVHSNLFNGL